MYTLADELWSIGRIVFYMMTSRHLKAFCDDCPCTHVAFCRSGGCIAREARRNGCRCVEGRCEHLPDGPCEDFHQFGLPCIHSHCDDKRLVNFDQLLPWTRYSSMLREAVRGLLIFHPKAHVYPVRAFDEAEEVDELYREWRERTKEGRQYRDIEDDMAQRWRAKKAAEARDAKKTI